MSFDVTSRDNQAIVSFFQNSRALILDPVSGSRTTIRRLLSNLGAKTSNVDATEHFEDAIAKMSALKPNIIVTELEIPHGNGLELINRLTELHPNSLDTIAILLSGKNSSLITSMAAESDADALIIKPFNYSMLEKKFVEIAQTKVAPTHYMRKIEMGKLCTKANKQSEAISHFHDAIPLDPKPALAYSLLAETLKKEGQIEEAKSAYQKGLDTVPNHYRSLIGLFELYYREEDYSQAYQLGEVIRTHHTLPPKRIPDFVRLSVLNHKFEDITSLYEAATSLENPDEIVVMYVSAALVICGKLYLRRNNPTIALELLLKAQSFGKNLENIQVECVSTLIQSGMIDEADALLARVPDAFRSSPPLMVLEMEKLIKLGATKDAINTGMRLIEKQIKLPKLYELTIEQSIKLKRPENSIREIISKATTLFPDSASKFEEMIKDYLSSPES